MGPAVRAIRQAGPVGIVLSGLAAVAAVALYTHNVRSWFFLGDDAFISFRYALHLVEGHGLVWNSGERVEGYSNFLWVLLLAAGMRLGIEPESLAPALGITSGCAVLLALAWFSARRLGWGNPFTWLPVLTLCLSRSFTAWSTGGLETQLFSLLVLLGFLLFVVERERDSPWPVASATLFAAASLTRPDGLLFVSVGGLFWLVDWLRGRRALGGAVIWALPILGIVGAHLLWRHSYYGFWLPNTFYAKVNGPWMEQSLKYFGLFNEDYRILWFVPLAVLAAVSARDFVRALFSTVVAVQVAYVAFIGGDRFEFRFLVVVLPYLYWLIGDGIRRVTILPTEQRWQRIALGVAGATLAAGLLVTTHLGSVRPEAKRLRQRIESVEFTKRYAARRIAEGKKLRSLIEAGVLPDDIVFSTAGAGAVPYYTRWPTVDFVGLNDVHIAHSPIDGRGAVAHEHRATPEYLREREVVVYDALNGMLRDRQRIVEPDSVLPTRFQRTESYGRAKVIDLGDDLLMVFRTLVSEESFRRSFGHLQILDQLPSDDSSKETGSP